VFKICDTRVAGWVLFPPDALSEAPASHTHFSGGFSMSEYLRSVLPAAGADAPRLVLGEQPFDVAANSFRLLTTGPEPLSIDGATFGGGLPARRIALSELAAILMHPSCGYATSDRVWRLLIEQARTGGPAWVVGAAGVAMPGLRQAAYRLRHHSGDVQAELLTALVAALRTVKPGGVKVAQRLLSATFTTARAALHAEEASRTKAQVRTPVTAAGHPDLVLAHAVTAEVITAAEAELIGATRLEDVSVSDYAERVGRSYWAVVKERSRAEERLVAAIHAGVLSNQDATVIAEATMTLAADPAHHG
jgi:hypothetical protein